MCTLQNMRTYPNKCVPDGFGACHEWRGFHSWKRVLRRDSDESSNPGDESAFVSYPYAGCERSLLLETVLILEIIRYVGGPSASHTFAIANSLVLRNREIYWRESWAVYSMLHNCVECSLISSSCTDQTDIAVLRYGMRCTTAGLENRIMCSLLQKIAAGTGIQVPD